VKPCRYCNLGKKTVVRQSAIAQDLLQSQQYGGFEASMFNASMAGSVMAGSAMAGSVMAGSVMAGSVMTGSVMAGSVMAGSVMSRRSINGASTVVTGPIRCQCRVEIKYKSKDDFHCSSLGYVDDSVDILLKRGAAVMEDPSRESRASLLGPGGQKVAPPKYRRLCCNCFNDRNYRVELEPQRARYVQSCAQCVIRKESAGNASL
jgi:hypothetical protein